jgi:hypothetical protein
LNIFPCNNGKVKFLVALDDLAAELVSGEIGDFFPGRVEEEKSKRPGFWPGLFD